MYLFVHFCPNDSYREIFKFIQVNKHKHEQSETVDSLPFYMTGISSYFAVWTLVCRSFLKFSLILKLFMTKVLWGKSLNFSFKTIKSKGHYYSSKDR